LSEAQKQDFEINAWAVYMHNSAIGMTHPETTVTNVFGNKFLSELCPVNKKVQGYAIGMTKDLASRGVKSIMAESLHFHGARHGEHHERFFMELSPVTEFLYSLCFCKDCKSNFAGNAEVLADKVKSKLQIVFDDKDPWLGKVLSKELLAEIVGSEILDYLTSRENAVAALYQEVVSVAHKSGTEFKYEDQSPLLDTNSAKTLDRSWELGIDNQKISKIVDRYEPLVYRTTPEGVSALANSYLKDLPVTVSAILRPTFPDCTEEQNLIGKVKSLRELGINEIDFYLLDTFRPRDLTWVKKALAS
jgi:hypothetical protein